jgi:xylulose-5-phosphate/fructose-6-phosphate phosphoketolase
VLNDLDRWHLVMDVLQRVPGLAAKTAYLKQKLLDKLIEHDHYIREHGVDLPEVREWSWPSPDAGALR